MAIRIDTDTTCSVPSDEVERYGITVVPQHVLFGTTDYLDQVDLDSDSFYDLLETSSDHPTTSQATPTEVADAMRPHVEAGDDVLGITISSKLSGTYSSFTQAAGQFPDAHIHVFDSLNATTASGLLVLAAARMVEGGSDVHAILDELEKLRDRTRLAVAVPTLEYLRRGGRIGNARALIGTLLGFKPILELREGELQPVGRARSMRRAISMLVDFAAENAPDGVIDIGFVSSGDPRQLESLRTAILDRVQVSGNTHDAEPLAPAIGAHVGREALAVAFISA